MRIKKAKANKNVNSDPVKNFEKWKKRYDKSRKQTKRPNKKRDWEIERENIQKLVDKYAEINPKEAVKFSDFPLSKKTVKGLLEAQYRQPTEIQRQTIGFALQEKDVLGAAKTGSGKTLAFLIPVLECLYRHQWTAMDGLGALIISPTRELAYQTFEVLRKVGKNHEFSAGLVIGGKDLKEESLKIHRTNIVICTPGRLLQHMDENSTFHASDLRMLVLDEADRILDMGFADTLNAIIENLPKTRQTLLFSATQTKSVKDLARLSLKDPEYVWVHEKAKFSTPATLEQSYVVCELHQKVDMLFSFLRSHVQKKIIVFFACCKEVQYLFRVFCRLRPGISVLALHGKQPQLKRVDVYNDFVRKKAAVLFATDIAARGLDFPAVNWVLQFDCPEDANTYIHRVGRTARYKEGGEALLILLPSEEQGMISQLQEKKVPINKIQVNPDKLVSVQQKLEAFLAQEKEQKERAQRCFVSYLRSIYLMKNKDVFDVFQLQLPEYATSLGLAVAPRVRFLDKAQQQRLGEAPESSTAPDREADQELESFKAQLRGDRTSMQLEEEEEDVDEEEEENGELPRSLLHSAEEQEDEDLDLDLLTVKRRDVFNIDDGQDEKPDAKQRNKKASKFKEVKKVLKRNFKVNTKKVFTEDGETVQEWPQLQRTVMPEDEDEGDGETSGINVEAAKERLCREDREFDKKEYSRKIKEKHREKRLKEKAARREASKRAKEEKKQEASGGGDEDEDEEVVAYLSGVDEEFDPSTLPDPDKVRDSEDMKSSDCPELARRKRARGSNNDGGSEDEHEGRWGTGRKKAKQQALQAEPLDTGLSLAEDEELVLHLLGSQS
ncbi:probable ATP-dependent RNA helicase DDX10 isoform X1 [Electrophorus electricus]|uniref:probable ATP-dependent RNA helicase DDX10 isoform X1 n=1 Tax=Electrophorus electricus TaxID=8005 RepID=UPI000F09C8D2|nr:probable ATP-dependent RNA helicase DDX10 isoform X1 [Electrophorus electricus]